MIPRPCNGLEVTQPSFRRFDHSFLYSLARQRAVVADLTSASSIEEFQRILRKKLEALEEAEAVGPYLEGAMWDQESIL